LALVGKDLIGDAFGVKAFHRCQVNNLLRNQLIPVSNDSYPDVAIVTSSGSPGVNVLVTGKPVPIVSARGNGSGSSFGTSLPAFPALSKAHMTMEKDDEILTEAFVNEVKAAWKGRC
jgi:hypothetical protein